MKKDIQIDFRSIDEAKVLKRFLEDKGKRHITFYHYTNLEALQKMLEKKGRKIFLTRMDKLNDALECKNDPDKKKRTYIASFSFGKAESMAMWAMYAMPGRQGIRLSIPLRAITKTLKNFRKKPLIYSTETDETIIGAEFVALEMIDVAYAHPGSLEHNKEKILSEGEKEKITKLTNAPELAFCIKNEVWLSENEVRMILELKEVLPGDIERIAIDFGPAVDELEVMGSPCISKAELKQQLKKLDGKRIHESFAYNKVYFRGCKDCNKRTDFCKKNKNESGK